MVLLSNSHDPWSGQMIASDPGDWLINGDQAFDLIADPVDQTFFVNRDSPTDELTVISR
jgi:hypothetical protein